MRQGEGGRTGAPAAWVACDWGRSVLLSGGQDETNRRRTAASACQTLMRCGPPLPAMHAACDARRLLRARPALWGEDGVLRHWLMSPMETVVVIRQARRRCY